MRKATWVIVLAIFSTLIFISCSTGLNSSDENSLSKPREFRVDYELSGRNELALFWSLNPEKDIEGYKLYRSTDSLFANSLSFIVSSNFYLDSGLVFETEYYYRIQAFNKSEIYSDYSQIGPVAAFYGFAPGVPTGFGVDYELSDRNALALYWNPNPEKDIEGYKLYRSIDSSFVSSDTIMALQNTLLDTGLAFGSEYYYKIQAFDKLDNFSDAAFFGPVSPYYGFPPIPPTGFTANYDETMDGNISLFWTANTERDLAGYKLYRDNGSGSDYTELGSTTQTSYTDLGLDYEIAYSYKIQAYDKSDNFSEFTFLAERIQSFNITAPSQPVGFTIYAHNIATESLLNIELTWSLNTESDFDHYNLYRATTGSFQLIESNLLDSLSGTSYTDLAVEVGIHYYYRLVAVDKGGLPSSPSVIVDDIPLAVPTLLGPIGGETATSSRPTFTWQRLEGADGYQLSLRESAYSGTVWETKVDQPATGNPQVTYPSSAPALSTGGTYYWQLGTYSQSDQTEVNSYSTIANFKIP